ncbi:hypothetical protein [Leptolyngbya sp. 7M]|uniref:hypothetical protein n=1 Tax=Leptolyngbya sp. 7M TaxID=2812896 RepID=UPI001B8ADADC|nr:hypothetical protein [Leptolyngbya sp. 7M]QYO65164.1 hypothetical protein JVX88_37720 [Leptolyngbya sp. 7M]
MGELLLLQTKLTEQSLSSVTPASTTPAVPQAQQLPQVQQVQQVQSSAQQSAQQSAQRSPRPQPKPAKVIFDEAEVLEVACGKLAKVFGPEYEMVDALPRCTRIPMPPYLFISRVTKLEAKRGSLEDCFIETEYDIPYGAWYTTGGYMPCAVAVEASHSNIFLMSYIGVDFETKGERVYRALGGTITFTGRLPKEGETMRCEVTAHSFSRMGETLLFTFTHKCFIGDQQFMQMECKAGFFSDEELLKGQGIPQSKLDQLMRSKLKKQYFQPLLPCAKTAFLEADLEQLNQGNFAACFGNDINTPIADSKLAYSKYQKYQNSQYQTGIALILPVYSTTLRRT